MTTEYHARVWRKAMTEAEIDVMSATATPPGGRKHDEGLIEYVERVKAVQAGAIARWMIAKAELDAATRKA